MKKISILFGLLAIVVLLSIGFVKSNAGSVLAQSTASFLD